MMRVRSYGESMLLESKIDVSYITEIKDDEVHVILELLSNDTSALQIKLDYDDTRLTFEETKFNTGNTTTNFGKSHNGRVNMGSINQNGGTIPINSTIKAIFKGNVSSAAGLISIVSTDAASSAGTRQTLNLQ